jgi:HK97 family phage prohead protease
MDRAFSGVTIKAISEDRREFEGWASTGNRDRQDDELVPEGAVYELPLPFLLDHDHTKVVGEVYKTEVSKRGIKFWGRIQKITEPGAAKDLVDYAWQLIKNRLRPVCSVGFRPLKWEPIQGGGLRYLSWEWFELSGVGIAANADARITAAKSAGSSVVRLASRPGAARVVKLDGVARARIAGTLKINAAPKWRPGMPIKINPPAGHVRVVKLDPQFRWEEPKGPARVVRLTSNDKRRAAHRVVKLRGR